MTTNEIADKTIRLALDCLSVVAPPPKLTVSEWADKYRVLPPGGPAPGQWQTWRTPYAKEPMDACCGNTCRRVILMCCAQMLKTEVMLNAVGYYTDYDACNMLFGQTTIEDARKFSRTRLLPLVELSPALQGKFKDTTSNDPKNATLRKEFPGGTLFLVGSNSPSGFTEISARLFFADEVDRWEWDEDDPEGDRISLGEGRQTNYWNALTVIGSTPTVKGESHIEQWYNNSTMEQWCVPCPSCGEYQPYEWPRLIFNDGPDESGVPEMACRTCGAFHNEYEWKQGEGRWIARQEHSENRGFHINAMASSFMDWTKLISEFREAKSAGVEKLRTFFNIRLAETWELRGDKVSDKLFEDRRHSYGCDVPNGVLFITAGVDVQKDRLEYEIVGWGAGSESWGIEYGVIMGDPHYSAVWNDLDAIMQQPWEREDGEMMPVECVAVDSGYAASTVYEFTRRRIARHVYAIKGMGGPSKARVSKFTWQGKNKNTVMFPVGTDASKDLVFTRLSTVEEGPDFCHFPTEEANSKGRARGYDENYFKGLTNEKRVPVKARGGMHYMWKKSSSHDRNEPLDCRVYASAALEIRNPDLNNMARAAIGTSGKAIASAGTKSTRRRGRRQISSGISVY